jgi:hypothetical protein
MKLAALPIAAAALALSACSGGTSTDNVTLSNDSADIEQNVVSEDLLLNDGVVSENETVGNIDAAANVADEDAANGAANAL